MTVTTRVRLLTANFRLAPESAEDIAAGHGWEDGRRDLTVDLLKAWRPSVICGQECSTVIRDDLAVALGGNWRRSRSGNVVVWFDSNQHTLLGFDQFNLPSPPAVEGATFDPRRLVLVHLRMQATGDDWWAASTHFTPGEPDWQTRQMRAAVGFITDNGDLRNTIFGGDINAGSTDTPGPRQVARTAGLYDLRGKLAAPRIKNVTSNTFNGWEPARHDGFWIDDILTGDNFQPYYARVIDTNGASDHQWIIASSIQLT
jgi:endonuclease/exonuclease/phosphatase family protein